MRWTEDAPLCEKSSIPRAMITICHQQRDDQPPDASRLLLLINAAATCSWSLAHTTADPDLAAAYSALACNLSDLAHTTAMELAR